MWEAVTKGFLAYMGGWSKPSRSRLGYAITVTEVSSDGKGIFVRFTFRSGHRFCCSASGCHHGLLFDSDYERLRECFRREGAEVNYPMLIHMRVVCEAGALFAANAGDTSPEYEPIGQQVEIVEVYDEATAVKSGADVQQLSGPSD